MSPRRSWPSVAAAAFLAVLAFSRPSSADTVVIKRPGAHPHYAFEVEPHALLGFVDPPGTAHGNGFGVGFRGTVELVDNGFIASINNTVGLGFGLDIVHYGRSRVRCTRRGPVDECVAFDDDFSVTNVWLPVVMQWNFWLSENWSVFGEPGLSIRLNDRDYYDDDIDIDPTMFIGGRFRLTEAIHLTMRVGHPTFTLGVSFLL